MKDDDGYLEAPAAAAYVGYQPTQVRVFYKFVRRQGVPKHYRGRRLVFKRSELKCAIDRCTDEQQARRETPLERAERLGRQHARGESIVS